MRIDIDNPYPSKAEEDIKALKKQLRKMNVIFTLIAFFLLVIAIAHGVRLYKVENVQNLQNSSYATNDYKDSLKALP